MKANPESSIPPIAIERREEKEEKEKVVDAYLESCIKEFIQPEKLRSIVESTLEDIKKDDFLDEMYPDLEEEHSVLDRKPPYDGQLTIDEICAHVQQRVQDKIEEKNFGINEFVEQQSKASTLRERVVYEVIEKIFNNMELFRKAVLGHGGLRLIINQHEIGAETYSPEITFSVEIKKGNILVKEIDGGIINYHLGPRVVMTQEELEKVIPETGLMVGEPIPLMDIEDNTVEHWKRISAY